MKLSDFKVLTFDCYGTLIDWETGIITALRPLLDRLDVEIERDRILERHAVWESSQQAQTPGMPYNRLLATVYRRLSEEWGKPADWEECLAYGRSVADWPAFPDSAEALAYLKRFYRLVILSNVDNANFAGSNRKLGVEFDAIYTAEDIGSYKPSLRNFDAMLEGLARLGHRKKEILHTAESMFHDHQPANRSGLASAWIHRRHAREGFGATMHPGEMPHYDFRFTSMAEMVEAHRREVG